MCALSIPELLNGAQIFVRLFYCGRVAPVKDHIAKEAYGKIKYYLPRFNNLLPTFETYGLAGLSQMRSAINYAQRIIDSEGGEAAYLLGKDNDCVNAFKYAMDIMSAIKRHHYLIILSILIILCKRARIFQNLFSWLISASI